jgi:cell division protein FtsI (penicillin-binding protein 3)
VDSLALGLAAVFKDKRAAVYRKELQQGYKQRDRFYLLKRKISYAQYNQLKRLPLVKLGRNRSGFIAVVRMKRLYPFRLLANRTIGIARDSNKVGLERQYDEYLRGASGKRLVRYIAGGAGVPLEGTEEDPRDGSDIVTTIDVTIQDAAQEALRKMMEANQALRGTCIVMEVATGKIRAMANLGRQPNGSYWEDYNYALAASEPGSTWKLVTLLAALEDHTATPETTIDIEGGKWSVAGQTVYDSEVHGMHETTVQKAFEKSSNVGMAKLAYAYASQPSKFIKHISSLHMDTLTGIDLPGESRPVIYKPGGRRWSNTTLPWMGFGYNLSITPLHTAMLYNAVANNGQMVKPYLVNAILHEGNMVQRNEPVVLAQQICSPATLAQVKACLEGVVTNGTARKLLTPQYQIAGKTGTSLVADRGITYADKMYQSSFAGYMPANNPQYTIVVVIRNRPGAAKFYGADVAGPVFREVADRLYATRIRKPVDLSGMADSVGFAYHASYRTVKNIFSQMNINAADSAGGKAIVGAWSTGNMKTVIKPVEDSAGGMPPLTGLGLKDALEICEGFGLSVTASGKGKVATQSLAAGAYIRQGAQIHLTLQ